MLALFSYKTTITVLEIGFESVQQKQLDKTIFDQEIVNFVQKTNAVPVYGL